MIWLGLGIGLVLTFVAFLIGGAYLIRLIARRWQQ